MLLLSSVFSAGIALICQPHPLKCHPSTVCLFPCGCSIRCTRPYPPPFFFLPSCFFLFTFQNKSAASAYQENTPLLLSCGNVVCWLRNLIYMLMCCLHPNGGSWHFLVRAFAAEPFIWDFLLPGNIQKIYESHFLDWHKTLLLAGARGLCCFSISAVLRPGPHTDAHF